MKLKGWILVTFILISLLIYFIFNRRTTLSVDNGRDNNLNRMKLHVPIIDDDMREDYAFDSFLASHWETVAEFPTNDEPLHYAKNITPIDPLNKVVEKDLFRKKINADFYYKFYIKSTIRNNTHSTREGLLVIADKWGEKNLILSETQIDSVARGWKLNYLVRDKVTN